MSIKYGGGHRTCSKCGQLHFGSTIHHCGQNMPYIETKDMKKILIAKSVTTFGCIARIEDKATKEQMEAMMGGYGIYRDGKYPEMTYCGLIESLDWFVSIFRMYGYEVITMVG